MAFFDEKKMTFWIFHSCPRECFWSAGWSLVTLLSVPNRCRRTAMKDPKENQNEHQTNKFQNAKSVLQEEKEQEL